MPSFMSVFVEEDANRDLGAQENNASPTQTAPLKPAGIAGPSFGPMQPSFPIFHQTRDSTSTSATDSTESSPTTTASLDSTSMTEPSPGPSPESPPSSMSPTSFVMDASRFRPLERPKTEIFGNGSSFFEMNRPATPAKKARNLKNLAVDTSGAYSFNKAIATAPFQLSGNPSAVERTSAPTSPTFVKPPTPPRRKVGNIGLTIVTPANSNIAKVGVPPTPSLSRPTVLRHFQSSPSLPLCTPGIGPTGGMALPNVRSRSGPRGFAEVPLEDEEDQEPNFDVPQSQEEKPDSYPNGPIRIYESGVDLYYEPSIEVASRYDVILNVASEVKNPFLAAESSAGRSLSLPSSTVGVLADTSDKNGSPTTPKATPLSPTGAANIARDGIPGKQPEYVHIPWEHNTDIVPDLYRLVKLIDDRVQQGKRVLVHCQCGVSRSASLIVAYGLFKNPGISVQEAYDAVKKRSKWIGPNMNLIMQLQEFRSALLRNQRREQGHQSQLFATPRTPAILPSTSSADSFGRDTPSTPATPRTAPLPPDRETIQRLPPDTLGPFSAGPVEPGTGGFWEPGFRRSWGSGQTSNDLSLSAISLMSNAPYVDPKGHIVPVVKVVENEPSPSQSSSTDIPVALPDSQSLPRTESVKHKTPNFSHPLPLRTDMPPPPRPDSEMPDVGVSSSSPNDAETVVSPRSEEFHMVPLHPPPQVDSCDVFGILSPSPPQPPRMSPSPPPQRPFLPRAISQPSSPILSPISTSFPPFQFPDTTPSHPFKFTPPQPRIDSLVPPASPPPHAPAASPSLSPTSRLTASSPPPPAQRMSPPPTVLRTKYSAPNLASRIRLQRLQTELASSISSHGPPTTDDALMSPRAGEFVANPFRGKEPEGVIPPRARSRSPEIASPISPEGERNSPSPTTPEKATDPRSPPQFGISPITRNIWDVL